MVQDSELLYAECIKSETKVRHQETERLLIPKLKAIRSKEDYVQILEIFYGFFEPVQERIEQYINEHHLAGIRQRRKSHSIQSDLFELNVKMKPDICTHLPAIHNTCQAFGAFYVLEGSTLGGAFIAEMLRKNEHLELNETSLSFFKGYGDNTLVMWQQFKEAMEKTIANKEDFQEVSNAANDTFEKLKNWIQNFN